MTEQEGSGTDTGSTDTGSAPASGEGGVSEVERFFVTDRNVGWLVGSMTLTATQISGGTLVGAVGLHYIFGVSFAAVWPGIWLGWLFSMYYVAPQMRRFGGVTVPEYLAARFDCDGRGGARVLALTSGLVAFVYLFFTAAQYVAVGVLAETVLGVPRVYGMVGVMAVTLAYTAAGGMRASIATDVVLMVVVVVGLVVAAVVSLESVGGPRSLRAEVVSLDPSLLGLGMPLDELVGFALAFGLAMAVAPYQISRVYAMSDEEAVRSGIKGSIAVQSVIAVCIAVVGLVAAVSFPDLANADAAMAEIVVSVLGPFGGWLLGLAVVAAIVSTLDSVLLVSASSVAYDLYLGVFRGEVGTSGKGGASDGVQPMRAGTASAEDAEGGDRPRTMLVARASTVAAGVFPLFVALQPGIVGELVQIILMLFASLIAGMLFRSFGDRRPLGACDDGRRHRGRHHRFSSSFSSGTSSGRCTTPCRVFSVAFRRLLRVSSVRGSPSWGSPL